MKILILTDSILPESGGGAEVVIARLMEGYLKAGHQLVVVTTVRDERLVSEKVCEGVKFYRIFSKGHERWRGFKVIYNPLLLRNLKKILKKERLDVAHLHNIHGHFSYWSLRLIKKTGIPIVLTLHDCQSVCYKKFDCYYDSRDLSCSPKMDYKIHFWQCWRCQKRRFFPLRNILIRHFLNKYPDKVIVVSNELKKLVEANGIKITGVVHNGVSINKFKIRRQKIQDFKNQFSLDNKKIVLFGGRLTEAKGGNQLLAAMGMVCQREPQVWLLVLAKENEYLRFFVDQAKRRGINILVAGWLAGDDLIAAFHSSDLVVTPSICFDTFGLINIEAMACKKPVITSCFGGGKEIVQNKVSGYVINPFDIQGFSQKILNLLFEEKAGRMGEAGFRIVGEGFELTKQVEQYLNMFNELCRG